MKDIIEFIGKATYDNYGQFIWGNQKEGLQKLADLRGWGAIQNLFKNGLGGIDMDKAAEFQDALGQFIVDAINEKIISLTTPQERDAEKVDTSRYDVLKILDRIIDDYESTWKSHEQKETGLRNYADEIISLLSRPDPDNQSVEFAEWILKHGYERRADGVNLWWGNFKDDNDYTTEQLLTIFKNRV